jgi:hypothetical protein
MSIINSTVNNIEAGAGVYARTTWAGLGVGDEGAPLLCPALGDRAIQVSGFFSGATVSLLGSLDGDSYHVLSDPQGNPLDITSAKIEAVLELAVYIKPVVTGGDVATDLNVMLCIKGSGR